MLWFWLTISAVVLFSINNHIDRYFMSKILSRASVGVLIIFFTISALPMLIIFWLIEPNVMNININNAGFLIVSGIIYSVAFLPYFYAMRDDEASNIVALFQIIPIFSFIFGYIFLGEVLRGIQILGSLCILLGSIVITLRYDGFRTRFNGYTFILMSFTSALLAATGIIFKYGAINENFWVANFWEYVGMSMLASVLLILTPTYRRGFIDVICRDPKRIIGLNTINEAIAIMGLLLVNYATLLVPVVLVSITASIQPLFVLGFGILITVFAPQINIETITKKDLGRKMFAIALIIVGSYFINR